MDKKTGESKLQKAGKRTLIVNSSESGLSNLVKYCQFMILFSARQCQYGVIGSLEKFFQWYGSLIATYPKHAILVSITITVLGGLGLFRWGQLTAYLSPLLCLAIHHCRFYEEGDAASMVIPRKSDFRKNIDWIDNNYPREVGGLPVTLGIGQGL